MVLSDVDIEKALKSGSIVVEPLFPGSIQGSTVDLHLGRHFLVFNKQKIYEQGALDPKNPVEDLMTEVEITGSESFTLSPGGFALGVTYETVGVDARHKGRLDGKSSVARLGISVHITSGGLDPGNRLKLTLEFKNEQDFPIKLYHKMPIAQMEFLRLSSEAQKGYGKKNSYFGSEKPVASQYYKNFLPPKNAWMKFRG